MSSLLFGKALLYRTVQPVASTGSSHFGGSPKIVGVAAQLAW